MNSLMDDNKLLTLANGERISMPSQITLLFETEDLSTASPATVSRAGIVYCDYEQLQWRPFFDSWLKQKASPVGREKPLTGKHHFIFFLGPSKRNRNVCDEIFGTNHDL